MGRHILLDGETQSMARLGMALRIMDLFADQHQGIAYPTVEARLVDIVVCDDDEIQPGLCCDST